MRSILFVLTAALCGVLTTPAFAGSYGPPAPDETPTLEEAKATFEAREAAAREELKKELLVTISSTEKLVEEADAGCSEAKADYIDAYLAKGRVVSEFSRLPSAPTDPEALAAYKASLELIKQDAEAQIAAASAKAEVFGTARKAALEVLAAARAELARVKSLEEPQDVARRSISSLGSTGFGSDPYEMMLTPPGVRRLTITLPVQFGSCGFPNQIQENVPTN